MTRYLCLCYHRHLHRWRWTAQLCVWLLTRENLLAETRHLRQHLDEMAARIKAAEIAAKDAVEQRKNAMITVMMLCEQNGGQLELAVPLKDNFSMARLEQAYDYKTNKMVFLLVKNQFRV